TNGVLVTFSLTNSSGATAGFVGGNNCTSAGPCTCSVIFNLPTSGQVAIHATISPTVGGIVLTRSTGDGLSGDSADANKTYVDAQLQISPLPKTNQLYNDHILTATVTTDFPYTTLFRSTNGVLVTFSLTNSSGATAGFV